MCTPIWEKENGITAQINFTVRNSHGGWPLHKMHSRFQQMLFPPFVIIRNELSIRFDINTMIMTILYDHDHKVKRALHYYDIHCVDDNLIWPLNLTIINGQPWEHWHWPSPSLWTWPLNMTIEYDHWIWPSNMTIEFDHWIWPSPEGSHESSSVDGNVTESVLQFTPRMRHLGKVRKWWW